MGTPLLRGVFGPDWARAWVAGAKIGWKRFCRMPLVVTTDQALHHAAGKSQRRNALQGKPSGAALLLNNYAKINSKMASKMGSNSRDLRQNEASHCEQSSSYERSHSAEQARLSVAVPKALYKRLKIVAHDRDMTVSALVLQLIRSEIN
jgi:hypothetical protein